MQQGGNVIVSNIILSCDIDGGRSWPSCDASWRVRYSWSCLVQSCRNFLSHIVHMHLAFALFSGTAGDGRDGAWGL